MMSIGVLYFIIGMCFEHHLKSIQNSLKQLQHENFDCEELKAIVKKHVMICELFEIMNMVYVPLIVVQFLIFGILLCLLGYQLTEVIKENCTY